MKLLRTTRTRRTLIAISCLALVGVACTAGDETDAGGDGAEEGATDADQAASRGLEFDGPDGDLVNADQVEGLEFVVTAEDPDSLDDLVVSLDGDDVTTDAEVADDTLTYAPGELDDGERTVEVTDAAEGDEEPGDPLHTWQVEVDTTPPEVELTSPDDAVEEGEPVTVAGTTEPGATVEVGDVTTEADDDGAFELELELDGAEGPLTVVVTDPAGNVTELEDEIAVVASRVDVGEVRGVHVTFWSWNEPGPRQAIIDMIEADLINAVQLDLKDEGGHLGYDSQVPLAQEIGSGIGPLDLEEAVEELHELGVAVVGRIVAFADPELASWAWENDRRDMVIQDVDGSDYYRGSYAGFSNYVHEDVIAYNLDIAEEAAAAGVDHILWDYIRRPEGIESYTVPGLETSPEEAIADFARQADERLQPYGVEHGASVYGIAADRPEQIGQDIPSMAEHLDYVAPMIYPSHWGEGEYGVADPNREPYAIINATMDVWEETVAEGDSDTRVVPWIEDTSYRAWDRPFQVAEQIRAAEGRGGEWLMWNPSSVYTPEAYEPIGDSADGDATEDDESAD